MPNRTNPYFTLETPMHTIPAGATGQLNRLDNHHVLVSFNGYPDADLVFDIYDTEAEVWSALREQPAAVRPCSCWRVASAVAISFTTGWLFFPQPNLAAGLTHNLVNAIGIDSD